MLALRSAANAIVVMPENGGGVLGWIIEGLPLLRRALPAAVAGNADALGWFPLVPYCNRIGQGRFRWAGCEHQLARNFGDHPHTIHGIGWQRAWTVRQAGSDHATLTLEHAGDRSWPFAFQSVIDYRLSPSDLTMTIAVTNRHRAPAPAGIGLHPYFTKAYDPSLRFTAASVWENGADALPSRHVAVARQWQHAAGRMVAASRLDNCFTGWERSANILAGPASLRIDASEAFRQLHVFTPAWADFFCAEPVSHAPDAINRPDLPADQAMHVLAPGETLSGTIRLTFDCTPTPVRSGAPPC